MLNYITREVPTMGRKVLPDQALDRVTVLKLWTTWTPKYMMNDGIGTLEAGKLADYTVLDKDYFTIPVADIALIKPQMTVMGGKIRALQANFAKDLNMDAVGYQFPDGYYPWKPSGGGSD
jgi:cytosine/adenosine deaminase-related metal-dependent hydrolase